MEEPAIPPDPSEQPQSPASEPPRRRRGRPTKAEAAAKGNQPEAEGSGGSSDKPGTKPARRKKPPVKLTAEAAALVQEELTAELVKMGAVMSLALPVTGTTIITRSEVAAAAAVDIGKRHPKVMSAIQVAIEANAWGNIASCGISVGIALGVDTGMVKPEGKAPQMFIGDVLENFAVAKPDENDGTNDKN